MTILFKIALNQVEKVHSDIEKRAELLDLRTNALQNLKSGFIKQAFDTRYINQETDTNPRRNLQYFHRNDPFITADMSEKLKTFFKLKAVVDVLKQDFHKDYDWHDSYCRILSASLDRTLRTDVKDMDFSSAQIQYLDELLYLRYRLKNDDINKLGEKELREAILNRDEKLAHKKLYANYERSDNFENMNKNKIGETRENEVRIIRETDPLIEKLMGNIKASADNKDIERSITITVRDKINEDIKKEG